MKKRNIITMGALVLFAACNSTENTEGNGENETVMVDTSQVADEVVLQVYETLEDYALINTKTELYEKFGADNIKEDTAWYAEGELMLFSSHLTDPNNGNIVRYIWQEDDGESLDMVEVYHEIYDDNYAVVDKQKVPSTSGLFSGMTLAELQDWNGEAFTFSGFGWDYGGNVFAKQGSKLSSCGVVITLSFDYEANYDGMDSLYGDIELSSDDPIVSRAPIFINYLSYTPAELR